MIHYIFAKKHIDNILLSLSQVIDFGCSECNFIRLLTTVPSIEQIAFVDVDKNVLISKKTCIFPEHRHYIFKRSLPLHVSMYAGSAEDVDLRLVGFEAITMIELLVSSYLMVLINFLKLLFLYSSFSGINWHYTAIGNCCLYLLIFLYEIIGK